MLYYAGAPTKAPVRAPAATDITYHGGPVMTGAGT